MYMITMIKHTAISFYRTDQRVVSTESPPFPKGKCIKVGAKECKHDAAGRPLSSQLLLVLDSVNWLRMITCLDSKCQSVSTRPSNPVYTCPLPLWLYMHNVLSMNIQQHLINVIDALVNLQIYSYQEGPDQWSTSRHVTNNFFTCQTKLQLRWQIQVWSTRAAGSLWNWANSHSDQVMNLT